MLELKSLLDGSIVTFERACVPHPTGEELGVFERDAAAFDADLGRCDEPPPGLEPRWCEARADACAEYPYTNCELVDQLCASSGTGGAGGATPVVPPPHSNDDGDGGCSIAVPKPRSPSMAAWVAALAALVLGSRRRRK